MIALRILLGFTILIFGLVLLELRGLSTWISEKQSSFSQLASMTSKPTTTPKDCAIVLTGGPGRVKEGFELLSQGQVKRLLISGVHPQTRLQDLVIERPYLKSLSENEVVLEKRSRTTFGNAQQTLPLVEAFQCRSVYLITSSLHMARALRTFQAIFPAEIVIVPDTIPSGPSFPDLLEEAMKSLFYRLLLWLDAVNLIR